MKQFGNEKGWAFGRNCPAGIEAATLEEWQALKRTDEEPSLLGQRCPAVIEKKGGE